MAALGVSEIAIWEAPHGFTVWQPRLGDLAGTRMFGYGLLLPQLPGLGTADGVRRITERWGLVDVAQLAQRIRIARGETLHPELSDLARRLTERDTVADVDIEAAFARFAATDGRMLVGALGIVDVVDATKPIESQLLHEPIAPGLGGFIAAIHTAATNGERLNGQGFRRLPGAWYERVKMERRLRWIYTREGERLRTASYAELIERVALELDHLLHLEPLLARCKLCGRVFVPTRPSRPEHYCRQNLWLERPPHTQLERCLPLAADRERIRKKLDQRYRRALQKHGDRRHPDVIAASDTYNAFVRDHPPSPRGRRPETSPDLMELPSDEGGTNGITAM